MALLFSKCGQGGKLVARHALVCPGRGQKIGQLFGYQNKWVKHSEDGFGNRAQKRAA
jgi:hypothetical protein